MKRPLRLKLILSFLVVALVTVLVVSALIRLTSGQSLMNLVVEQQTAQLEESVTSYYTANGSLDGFFAYYVESRPDEPHPDDSGNQSPAPGFGDLRGVFGLVDAEYRAIMPTFGIDIGQQVPADMIKNPVAVKVNGETIAWILPDTKFQFKLSAEEELFLKRTSLAIGTAAAAGVAIAILMGALLTGYLVKPIQRLTTAAKALAEGDLKQQVPVTSQDELGLLTETFNQMSSDLNQADLQRKRLTADITHDLSTPLQIISGYMEMLESGQVTLTGDRIEIIKTEIEHLRRMVSDLTTLSQVEAGGLDIQAESVQPELLLQRVYQAYQPIAAAKGVTLELNVPSGLPAIYVDEGRMLQVLKNLVDNALRHTPAGGNVTLEAADSGLVELRITDSGEGIDADDLPYVFDRFFRADKARPANSGKMGLGLAICKALVSAQGGKIKALSAGKGQGTSMVIAFPPQDSGRTAH